MSARRGWNPIRVNGTCQDCRFSGEFIYDLSGDVPATGDTPEDERTMVCRRFPPVLVIHAEATADRPSAWQQPTVMVSDVCGEWRAM